MTYCYSFCDAEYIALNEKKHHFLPSEVLWLDQSRYLIESSSGI